MAKKVVGKIGLALTAGKATPAPPVGPALGPYSLNIMDFCKQYNERTQSQAGMIIPVEITVFEDRTFTFVTKTPPASFLIKRALGIESGSKEPNRNKVGKLTQAQIREIATTKMPDLNANDIDHAMKIIAGTARSMGVEVAYDAQHGKRFRALAAAFDRDELYDASEAAAIVKKNANAKFNETIEIHIRLGVDPEEVRSERARHGQLAARYRADGARHRVRHAAIKRARRKRPAPTSSARTT